MALTWSCSRLIVVLNRHATIGHPFHDRRSARKVAFHIQPRLSRFVSVHDNDVVSRIEQQICSESSIFLGTSMSSWTSRVIEERFQGRSSFFMQDKYNVMRRPDLNNDTMYFDIEVCNCDWEA